MKDIMMKCMAAYKKTLQSYGIDDIVTVIKHHNECRMIWTRKHPKFELTYRLVICANHSLTGYDVVSSCATELNDGTELSTRTKTFNSNPVDEKDLEIGFMHEFLRWSAKNAADFDAVVRSLDKYELA